MRAEWNEAQWNEPVERAPVERVAGRPQRDLWSDRVASLVHDIWDLRTPILAIDRRRYRPIIVCVADYDPPAAWASATFHM